MKCKPLIPGRHRDMERIMKILFLDFDGPLYSTRIIDFHPRNHRDDPLVQALNKAIQRLKGYSGPGYAHFDPTASGDAQPAGIQHRLPGGGQFNLA